MSTTAGHPHGGSTSEITLEVDRPSRYLAQLCRHAAAIGKGGHRLRSHADEMTFPHGEFSIQAEYTDTQGTIIIHPWGRCTLQAAERTLTVNVEATTPDALRQIQHMVAGDLERFGRRDGLTVNWPPPDATTAPDADAPNDTRTVPAVLGRRSAILLALLIAALLAIHLGLGGAILAHTGWAGLSTGVIIAVVFAKLLLVAMGRRAIHSMLSHRSTRHRERWATRR